MFHIVFARLLIRCRFIYGRLGPLTTIYVPPLHLHYITTILCTEQHGDGKSLQSRLQPSSCKPLQKKIMHKHHLGVGCLERNISNIEKLAKLQSDRHLRWSHRNDNNYLLTKRLTQTPPNIPCYSIRFIGGWTWTTHMSTGFFFRFAKRCM